ncbi:MAG: hypothetical protein C6W56_00565 [Caldibacillus debilis]|nr:MAG: hypothetical protein BAA03_08905 [Caldibacillus debilis]REJ31240.1 MAG: hypothetical protein C6W56_00565 [Caldibacillus debilis]
MKINSHFFPFKGLTCLLSKICLYHFNASTYKKKSVSDNFAFRFAGRTCRRRKPEGKRKNGISNGDPHAYCGFRWKG